MCALALRVIYLIGKIKLCYRDLAYDVSSTCHPLVCVSIASHGSGSACPPASHKFAAHVDLSKIFLASASPEEFQIWLYHFTAL